MSKVMIRMLGLGAVAGMLTLWVAPASAQTTVVAEFESTVTVEHDVSYFYDELAPYGHWIGLPPYGWVWQPAHVPHHWHPYTIGHWVLTDEYGWLWVSDLDWGWAPFHYGRWTFDPHFGWVWVPDTEWGPAWVAWRSSDEYIGWAPLPPQAEWHADVGLTWGAGGVDVTVGIHPEYWSFVAEGSFLDPHVHQHCVEPGRNVVILAGTRDATHYAHRDGRVVNVSVPVDRIERRVGRRIARRTLRQSADAGLRKSRVDDDAVSVFRPKLAKRPASKAPKRVIQAKSPGAPGRAGHWPRGLTPHEPQRVGGERFERSRGPADAHGREAHGPQRTSQEREHPRRSKGGSPKSKKRHD